MEPASQSLSFTFIKPDAAIEDITLGLATAKTNHKAYLITSLAIYQEIQKVVAEHEWRFVPIVGYPDGLLSREVKKQEVALGFRQGGVGLVYVLNPGALEDKAKIQEEIEGMLEALPSRNRPVYLYFPYGVGVGQKSNLKVVLMNYPNIKMAFNPEGEAPAPLAVPTASPNETSGVNPYGVLHAPSNFRKHS